VKIMTDAAPAAAEAVADTPSAPIEQQVQTPNPAETTIPVKEQPEVKAEAKPERRSVADSLKHADEKLRTDAEKGEKAKAEPKPEAKESAKAEAKPSEGPKRDETGKFASKDGPKPAETAQDAQKPVQTAEQPQKAESAFREAPKRFDDGAKAEWEKVPESVRGAVHRTMRELETGLEQYKAEYEPLKEYSQLAKQHGTTIKDGLDRYIGLERQLMSQNLGDKIAAIRHVFDYAGLNIREFAARILGQTPEQATVERDNEVQSLRQTVARLEQQLTGVNQSMQQQSERDALSRVEEFARANPRLNEEEFSSTVARLLQTKMADDLPGAYEMAERLHPAPQTARAQTPSNLSTQQAADDQTVKGSKSVSGAPGTGTLPAKRKPSSSIMEALRRAEAAAG
jgi:hypothetical protein